MNKEILLTQLIAELADDVKFNEKMKSYKYRFNSIYADGYRHEYSEVTRVLFSIDIDESRDFLIEKIKSIRDEIEDDDIKQRVSKLLDHINLENIRMRELNKISLEANNKYIKLKNEYNKLQDKMDDIKNTAIKVEKDLDTMDKNIDNSTTKSITILGIFAGIVMAFTGGLTFIASALQSINAISQYRLVFIIILLSAAIFNIIFMLIYVIGRITGSYIGSKCNCSNQFEGCHEKTNGCSTIRYPIAIWFNVAVLISLFATFVLYIVDRYNLLTIAMNINFWLTIIVISLAFIGVIISIIVGLNKLLKIECKYEPNENILSKVASVFGSKYRRKS